MPFAYFNSQPIYFELEGNPHATPMVLLHGFLGSSESWRDVNYVRTLQPHFQIILIDLPGYGKSYKPHQPPEYELINRCNAVIAVLNHLNITKAHFFGFSMGGRICYGLAKYYPNYCKSIIIGAMSPYGNMPVDLDHRITMLQNGMHTVLAEYELANGKLPKNVAQRILTNDPQALIADTIETKNWKGIDDLSSINTKILLFIGDQDPFLNEVKQAASELPRASIIIMPSTNHYQSFVRRHLIQIHISRFLNKPF